MSYEDLLRDLETLLRDTYALWDEGWVTFNWRNYTYDHVQRVRGLAVTLCRAEGGDPAVAELAALLHDVTKAYDGEYLTGPDGKRLVDEHGYWRNEVRRPPRSNAVTELYDRLGLAGQLHNESGATLADHLLRERGVDAATCDRVATVIRDHLVPAADVCIESRCLYDADTIDANIGLPAFVRNIYINLHFYDGRKAPEAPGIDTVLAATPLSFLRPYITENLPNWSAGKRRDFVPKLLTAAAVPLCEARLERLERYWRDFAADLARYGDASSAETGEIPASATHHSCLDVMLHYMTHRGDPCISAETEYLATDWIRSDGASPEVADLVAHLSAEMAGRE